MLDVAFPVRFAPNQTLPPGYSVEWWSSTEHYHWVHDPSRIDGEPEVFSVSWSDRFAARRSAWRHYNQETKE